VGSGKRHALHTPVAAHYYAVSMKKKDLQLLGIWNESPFSIWVWHCDAAKEHFYGLTKRYIHTFAYITGELNHQCFVSDTLKPLKSDFERMNSSGRLRYVRRMAQDYYTHVKPFELYIKKYRAARFRNFADARLVQAMQEMARLFPLLTMQAWYAVLIDIWFPSPKQCVSVKRVIGASRDHLGRLHAHSAKIDNALLREIGRRTHKSLREMHYLFPEEAICVLQGKDVPSSTMRQRMKFCVTTDVMGPYSIYGGSRAQKITQKYNLLKQGNKKQGVLQGTPANPGIICGRVRRIVLDREFKKFKQGEVLVALQTMVHYVPLMKKSKAILTEFGGLTSHAAIVSRELKKPCIVSIPNLIASLKDGDRVEVDAEKGVVRKI